MGISSCPSGFHITFAYCPLPFAFCLLPIPTLPLALDKFANPVVLSEVEGSPRRSESPEVTELQVCRQVVSQPL